MDRFRRPKRLSALLIIISVLGSAALADDLSGRDFQSAATKCRASFEASNDKEAIDSCKTLELLLHPNTENVGRLMGDKASGKILSFDDFMQVYYYVAYQRLATTIEANVYARNHIVSYGRAYAVQAVGWSMYDAKDCHDLIRNGSALATRQPGLTLREVKAQLLDDKAIGARMERLYPGVLEAGVRRLRMSVAQYRALMAAL